MHKYAHLLTVKLEKKHALQYVQSVYNTEILWVKQDV